MSASDLNESVTDEVDRRILRSLLAYAAGDAFGVAYEYRSEPLAVDMRRITERSGWPVGGVSDDTLLSLITIESIAAGDPEDSARTFMDSLRRAAPTLRGLGPTTRAALGLPDPANEGLTLVGSTVLGNTNGGMMRTALTGLGFPISRDNERRKMVAALAAATHPAAAAIACAVVSSALYSRAMEDQIEPTHLTIKRELDVLDNRTVTDIVGAAGTWSPPERGISLDPIESLAAVIWVAERAADVLDAYRLACEIGGDTDTVAALAGGLVAARSGGQDLLEIRWIDDVAWDEIPHIASAAATLADLRGAA